MSNPLFRQMPHALKWVENVQSHTLRFKSLRPDGHIRYSKLNKFDIVNN